MCWRTTSGARAFPSAASSSCRMASTRTNSPLFRTARMQSTASVSAAGWCPDSPPPSGPGTASPLKLFEYMAAGLPIIAPDQANIREILTNGLDAILVDPDRPEALAQALTELCRDVALRARTGAAARATIDRRGLTWLNNARRVVALIAGQPEAKGGAAEAVDGDPAIPGRARSPARPHWRSAPAAASKPH